jgi:membrane-associated phospholipid phosphatase
MKILQPYKYLSIAIIISLYIAAIAVIATVFIGNIPLFLWLNFNGGHSLDIALKYITQTGEVIPWFIALVYMLLYKKQQWKILVFSFIFSTLLAQGIKNILPTQPRPTKAIGNTATIHTVQGIELHEVFSFPSGHTTTAFTIFLLAVILIPKPSTVVIGLLYAIAVAYSRIYLAQHFAKDIAGGIVCACVAVYASLCLHHKKSNQVN